MGRHRHPSRWDPQRRRGGPQSATGAARHARPIAFGLTVLFALFGLFVLWTLASDPSYRSLWGVDRAIYVTAAQRWLTGGSFYHSWQLSGTYDVLRGAVLYPPVSLWLFVPASFVPAVAWRLVPLIVIAAVIAHHRPAWWTWPLIAAFLGFQWSVMIFASANPTLWIAAIVALGTIWTGPSVAVLVKPTLAPFALIGAGRRRWWIAFAVFAALCVPFGAMWIDWVHVIANARGWRVGPLYSLGDVPWLLVPVIARIGRTSGKGEVGVIAAARVRLYRR